MEKKTFAVLGMMCAGCAANVERRLSQTEGVASVAVNLPARTALIEYDNAITSPEQLKAALSAIGYDMVIEEDRNVEAIEQQAYRSLTKKVAVSWGLALLVMARYCKPDHADSRLAESALPRQAILREHHPATETCLCQYGHAGCPLYGHFLPLQCFQHLLGRSLLGSTGH